MRRRLPAILALLLGVTPATHATARDTIPGPVPARVLRVLDGDTVEVEALVWPGHSVRVSVRIRGIDAPELRSRCHAEKDAALAARAALVELLADGTLEVRNVGADKFFGRVVADVATSGGDSVADLLIERAVVRPYDGLSRVPFCEE